MRTVNDVWAELDAMAEAMVETENDGQEIEHVEAIDLAYLVQELMAKMAEEK